MAGTPIPKVGDKVYHGYDDKPELWEGEVTEVYGTSTRSHFAVYFPAQKRRLVVDHHTVVKMLDKEAVLQRLHYKAATMVVHHERSLLKFKESAEFFRRRADEAKKEAR